MKTWEALKAADEGKKIRRKWWSEGIYCLNDEGARLGKPALITHYGFGVYDLARLGDLDWDDIFADDWEIYEEEEVNKK